MHINILHFTHPKLQLCYPLVPQSPHPITENLPLIRAYSSSSSSLSSSIPSAASTANVGA